jgi:hypothetical protein
MKMPPANLSWFAETLTEVVEEISDAWSDDNRSTEGNEAPPELLQEALQQLILVLRQAESIRKVDEADIGELGEYGLKMLTELSQISHELKLQEVLEKLELLALSLALWVIQQKGELHSIGLVVNGLARVANFTTDTFELERLFHTIGEIMEAIQPLEAGETMPASTREPLQLLLLNRAIVATRAHLPRLMEVAFSDVIEKIPEAAPGFFHEGMEQIELQGYPEPVSNVIERYHRQCVQVKILH